ncbi:MAG: small multi-drug export protein [Pelagibacterales bacterium]|nr:small multi-drug export protein [Pelagibacterales bacterium]
MNNIIFWSIFLSILPIAELRGGIPYAIANDLNPLLTFFICVGANILVFPIVFFFLEFLHPLFLKIDLYKRLFDKFIIKTREKIGNKIEKYGFWGLMIFVMIPLPVTGAYTGSFAAWLFNIPKKKAFLAVSLGVIMAGIIVTTIVLTGIEAFQFLLKDIE